MSYFTLILKYFQKWFVATKGKKGVGGVEVTSENMLIGVELKYHF